jgi:hypothetical protein
VSAMLFGFGFCASARYSLNDRRERGFPPPPWWPDPPIG